jgi:hypothetical protein
MEVAAAAAHWTGSDACLEKEEERCGLLGKAAGERLLEINELT